MADTSPLPLSKGEAIKDKESDHIVEDLQEMMVDEIDNAAKLPWLMLADSPTNSYRRFYSLTNRKFLKIDLPRYDEDPEDHRRYFSSKGWLIGVSRNQGLMSFFDPFFGQTIKPPIIPLLEFVNGDLWDDESYLLQFHKFVFSTTTRDDFQVAMIHDSCKRIAFWRPGQQQWIQPAVSDLVVGQVEDVCFFRNQFYSIDHFSRVISFGEAQTQTPQVVVNLQSEGLVSWIPIKYYIAVLNTTLLVIHRTVWHRDDHRLGDHQIDGRYGTVAFRLFQVDVDTGTAKEVKDIGNRALFVGHASTFIVEASGDGGCRPNCIYFTDDNDEKYFRDNSPDHGGGIDMGIYSLDEHKLVDRLYQGPSQLSYETPPLWVELPSHY